MEEDEVVLIVLDADFLLVDTAAGFMVNVFLVFYCNCCCRCCRFCCSYLCCCRCLLSDIVVFVVADIGGGGGDGANGVPFAVSEYFLCFVVVIVVITVAICNCRG